MQRSLRRNLLFLGIALLIITGGLVGTQLISAHAYMQERIAIDGQTAPLSKQAQVVEETANNLPLQLSIGLQLRDRAGANRLLAELSDPQSPSYHHYLTPEQFKQFFAPGDSQVQQVAEYLRAQGLVVNNIASNNLLINATGTVAQVETGFQTQIKNYRLGKRSFHANANVPSLPREIALLVSSIGGLDNSVQYKPAQRQASNIAQDATVPTGLDPQALEKAYNLGPLHQAGIQGQGQTVALFTLDGYLPADVSAYFQNYSLPQPTIEQHLVDNVNGDAGQGALETTLDIEMLGAVAPQSTILVYQGPNTVQGISDTYTKIVSENRAKVVSTSWGLCEASTGSAQVQTLNNIFTQGALQGISFFAAAGDAGAYDCQDSNLAVDSPASDPNVTAVGATGLAVYDDGSYASETAWSDSTDKLHGPQGSGSGGGLSSTFAQPSWQSGTGVDNQYSNGKRQVPDVAAFGDPAQGFAIYCTVTNAGCPTTGWTTAGGSSVAAPFWAASLLLVNQYLQANNLSLSGQINPLLYKLFSAQLTDAPFHDVTSGSNLYYPTTSGYDLASGLGTPNVYNLARGLASLASAIPAPTPTATSVVSPTATVEVQPTATPSPTPVPVVLQNGGFEVGTTPWRQSSSGGFTLIDTTNPHRGSYSAFLCGYVNCNDQLWQAISVPASYTRLTLTYYWYGSKGASTQCVDTLTVRLRTVSGTLIKDVQQLCNTQATEGWVAQTVDLSAALTSYKGQSVTLLFWGINGASQSTTFFIDDANIAVS
jgi:subtilase family serine protease